MTKKRTSRKPLTGRVALVAGATRGAGRGIARALAEAGATVYCTGRSVKGQPSPYGRPETIEETSAMIKAAGGSALALRVDHTRENEVKALFRRILRAHKRIDVVVDSVAGEDPLMGTYGFLWQADLTNADAIFRQGLISRITTAKHAALAMMAAKCGLLVEVTENDMIGGGGNPMAQRVYRIGAHCQFSQPEMIKAFDDLVKWVRQGTRPEGDEVFGDLSNAGMKFTEPLRPGDPGGVRVTQTKQ